MTKKLIFLALILIPFVLNPLTVLPFIPTIDGGTRPPKEFIALIFSLAIFLSALFNGEIKSFHNKWYLIFLFYLPFAIWHSPPFITLLGQHNVAGSWQWQPFCYILIYTLLIITVSNLKFTRDEILKIFSIITMIGVLMALYVIGQKFNVDQFFIVKSHQIIGHPKNPELMGTLGNSTIVSAFLVMCLPFCYYMKRWGRSIVLICAVLLCESQMSTGSMIVCLVLYSLISYPKVRPYLGTLCVTAAVLLIYLGIFHRVEVMSRIGDNGRFVMWEETIKDINEPPIKQDINTPGLNQEQKAYLAIQNERKYPMTGLGLGSFKIMYSEKHKEAVIQNGKIVRFNYPKWGSPHNAYIHVAYTIGFIGLGLLSIVLWTTLWPAFLSIKFSPDVIPVFTSVISVLLLSLGAFILEIEPTRIYTAIFMGLLLNSYFVGEKREQQV